MPICITSTTTNASMSSELSNALNPYIPQPRARNTLTEYQNTGHPSEYQHVPQPVASGTGLFVPPPDIETFVEDPPHQQQVQRQRNGAQVLTELYRLILSTREAQEVESKRRLEWEKEMEERFLQRQEDMTKKMESLTAEIVNLKSAMDTRPIYTPPVTNPSSSTHPSPRSAHRQLQDGPPPVSPISPIPQPAYPSQPLYVQGSSSHPLPSPAQPQPPPPVVPQSQDIPVHPVQSSRLSLQTYTPDPSPQLTNIENAQSSSSSTRRPSRDHRGRKRRRSRDSSDDDRGSDSDSGSSSPGPVRVRRRKNNHDTESYTIHHAIKQHILRLMRLNSDRELPESHVEGTVIGPHEPVRFVWEKTVKQSVHNGNMKTRVLEDLKQNHRSLYKKLSSSQFTNKKLVDQAFEQVFTTLRQKFKAQTNEAVAQKERQREEMKARKARRVARRKLKLDNRAEARQRHTTFHPQIFDGAMLDECMSSEESDVETDGETGQKVNILRSRPHAWRSDRLRQFYNTLDEEDKQESSSKPKRGVGRRERRVGPPKEGVALPPAGTERWMVSKKWYKANLVNHPTLKDLIVDDDPKFDWNDFHELGEASEDEEEQERERERERERAKEKALEEERQRHRAAELEREKEEERERERQREAERKVELEKERERRQEAERQLEREQELEREREVARERARKEQQAAQQQQQQQTQTPPHQHLLPPHARHPHHLTPPLHPQQLGSPSQHQLLQPPTPMSQHPASTIQPAHLNQQQPHPPQPHVPTPPLGPQQLPTPLMHPQHHSPSMVRVPNQPSQMNPQHQNLPAQHLTPQNLPQQLHSTHPHSQLLHTPLAHHHMNPVQPHTVAHQATHPHQTMGHPQQQQLRHVVPQQQTFNHPMHPMNLGIQQQQHTHHPQQQQHPQHYNTNAYMNYNM